jgi:hypothetical protein
VEAPEQRLNTRDDGMGIDHATQVLGDDQYPTKEADLAYTVAVHAALPDLLDALGSILALLDASITPTLTTEPGEAPDANDTTQPQPAPSHDMTPWGRAQASFFRTCRKCHGWQRAGVGNDAMQDELREPCPYA